MTKERQTSTYLTIGVLANVLVLCLCALIWFNAFAEISAEAGASILAWYLGACALALIITNILLILFMKKFTGGTEKALIGIILLLVGLFVNVIYLPLNVPDEIGHFAVTYNLSGKFYSTVSDGERETEWMQSGIWQSESDASTGERIHSFWYDFHSGNEVTHNETDSYVGNANYPTYGYLPAAAAIAFARFLSAPYQVLLILGRMANYIAFLILVLLACRIAPDLCMGILAITALPSTIWLAASYSYDGWNLGFSILFIAYLWRLTSQKEKVGIKQILCMVLLLLAFAPIKYIYVLLGLLVFAIPRDHWKNLKVVIGAVLICGVGGVIALWSRLREVLELLFTSTTDTRGLEQGLIGEPYTVSYVAHHPIEVACTFIKTFYTDMEAMIERMLVGEFNSNDVPGYLTVVLGILFVLLMLVATKASLAGRERTGRGILTTWYYRGVFVLGILAIYGSFLFLYSYHNKGRIDLISGVQGRYFLPLILLLAPAGSARLAVHCTDWMEHHEIRSIQLWAVLMYVGVLVLLCRMPGFVM